MMGCTHEGSERAKEIEVTPEHLIPGLSDDCAFLCLVRLPRRFHAVLRCVSKRWRDTVCSDEWHSYRRKHNLDEAWIYALCRDRYGKLCCYVLDPNSSRRLWKLIPGVPPQVLKRQGVGFEALGKRLYILGGCGWSQHAHSEVYYYDASTNAWSEAASLPTARCYFACEVLEEKIYAIGGLGSNLSDPYTWDTYDPCTNSWRSHSDHNLLPEVQDSVVYDGKIYIRCGASPISSNVYAIVYEPSSGLWQHADVDIASGWQGPAAVIDGTLYVLDQSCGLRLTKWKKESNYWLGVRRFREVLAQPPRQLVAIGKRIIVVGKGLSTLMFDVDHCKDAQGIMAVSSIPKLSYDLEVISCKVLAL